MQPIEWNPSFSVGVAKLDDDHRLLLEMINRLCQAWVAGKDALVLGKLFDAMLAYANTHFAREEAMLAALGYDGLGDHRKKHATLKSEVLAFRQRHIQGGAQGALTREAAHFLGSWLVDHIIGEDKHYRHLFVR